jgi:signal transduction histidine kinase/CheY-like chemotaxis protein
LVSLPLLTLEVRLEADVVLARQRARQIAGLVGFAPLDQTRIATAVSEIARNAFQYGGGAKIEFLVNPRPAPGLLIRVRERGQGIKDLRAILDGRYDSPTGLGLGILGAKRLMDQFEIESSEAGAVVTMSKTLPPRAASFSAHDLARVSAELAQHQPLGLLEELQLQNQELLRTLEELRGRQAEVAELHRSELDDTNRGVVALYSELDANANELKRISDLKTRFLSNMSHEFRSPLNTILGMSGFLLDGSSGDLSAEQRKEVSFIRKAAEGLAALVNDLLDLAKVEAGKAVIRPETFEVSDLFESLRGMTRPLLTDGLVNLVFDEPVGITTLHTDEGKVAQILRNFLTNAAKFTERGEIRVAAKPGPGDTVLFSVTDTGIGIAPADQAIIFEEFGQIEGPVQNRVQGTGLGLPLSRKLAELLGGDVSVRSEPGVGSTFFALIPISYRDRAELEAAPESQWPIDPHRSPLVVVDDDPVDLLTYEKLVEGSGFQIIAARTLGDARRVLRRINPVAVLLDVRVEMGGGWTFLSELKNDAATNDLPILVVDSLESRERALGLGAADFGLKPIDRLWLLDRLGAREPFAPLKNVLIIDDREDDRYHIKGLLAAQGRFTFVEAASGEEGLQRARSHHPDVIFLDLVMPDMTGFEVLERLRTDDELKGIPVIINTSADLGESDRQRLGSDAAAILSKSISSPEAASAAIRDALIRALAYLNPAGTES